MKRLISPSTIGIIGGGQLGQMMALSAIESGYKIAVLDPDPSCPAACLASTFIQAAYDDEEAFAKLHALSDVVTYEFENVDYELIKKYQPEGKIPQGSFALKIAQNRLNEKDLAKMMGVPVTRFTPVQSKLDLLNVKHFPIILKKNRLGYDGKGQWRINSKEEALKARIPFPGDYIAESVVDFDKEISIVATRFKDGITTFEAFENTHENGILRTSIHPADISEDILKEAIGYTELLIASLKYIGVMAIEYFVTQEGVLLNEIAPRPHNSAHGTIEGCDFSQFDCHIAAITGSKPIQPKRIQTTAMLNILGQDLVQAKRRIKNNPQVHLHLYGKAQSRTNRKMGHLTFCGNDREDVLKQIEIWRKS